MEAVHQFFLNSRRCWINLSLEGPHLVLIGRSLFFYFLYIFLGTNVPCKHLYNFVQFFSGELLFLITNKPTFSPFCVLENLVNRPIVASTQ